MSFRRRAWYFVLSVVIATALITQQIFIQVPLVQAQTWTEYYDSLSENPLPAEGVSPEVMFNGSWNAAGYQCLSSASTFALTAYPEPYPETVNVTVKGRILNATTVYGSKCTAKGEQTFVAYPVTTITNQLSIPITFFIGTGDNPIPLAIDSILRVIDADYFVIRVPSFKYLGSEVEEKPLYIEFRRKSQSQQPVSTGLEFGKLFPEETKNELNKASDNLDIVATATLTGRVYCSIFPPATKLCKLPLVIVSAVAKLLAFRWQQLALDPPDPNYTIIYQPVFFSLPDIQVQPDLTQAEADAFNALIKNQLQAIGFADAAYISYNRASGAINAGDITWKQAQLYAANQYMQELANSLDVEPTLLTTLVNTLQANGVLSATIKSGDVSNFKSSIIANGLPSDLVQVLQQLGADNNTIDEIKLLTVARAADAVQGDYPQNLANQALLESIQQVVKNLRTNTIP